MKPATIPPTDGIKTNGDLVRYGKDCLNSLVEVNSRLKAAREYRENCEKIALETK